MDTNQNPNIKQIVSCQKEFFASGRAKDVAFRLDNLKKLSSLIEKFEDDILDSVHQDLRKSNTETFTSEIFYVMNEIRYFIKNLKKLSKSRSYRTPLINLPGSSRVLREPYGSVLVASPWNYPFGLLFTPIAGAIAAGNCIIAKPSELAQNTSKIITKIINDNFRPEYFITIEGGAPVVQEIIRQGIDYIFFTGSTKTGREIMKAAADGLIPLTMELSGKNPCLVDTDIDIDTTVRRILWGKFFNSGQTCVAPDFVFIHKDMEKTFLEKSVEVLAEFYGNGVQEWHTSRIINEKHFDRLNGLLSCGEIVAGGQANRDTMFISPTIIRGIDFNNTIMQDEIFGPILPVLVYDKLEYAVAKLNAMPKPLSLYFFSGNKMKQEYIERNTNSGSLCINGTIHIILSGNLPFGGIGHSGMGTYHGRASYETFTYQRSVLKKSFLFDSKYLYPPYNTPIKTLKKVLRFFY